ncbi:MAG: reverse transcriptase domain-containing protein, partial [Sweet potato little leaf phytoplasma]|nr:reverse transcriptase domain-containing protein [Sweet potato little leaf phytoplasma]
MDKVLPDLVQDNQNAFVKDRNIIHNVLMTQELIRLYGRRKISPRCMMKIDLRKAYDTLEWQFIEDMLTAMKFPEKFRKWVMACIKSVSYSIIINGQNGARFYGSRGIRQGDPLSPQIFVLAMEILTRNIQLATNHRNFSTDLETAKTDLETAKNQLITKQEQTIKDKDQII